MAEERNHHEKIMKQYDLEITKLKYQNIKKDIQLIKAQTELASVSKSDINTTEFNKYSYNTNIKTKLMKLKSEFIDDESSEESSKSITNKKSHRKNSKNNNIMKL